MHRKRNRFSRRLDFGCEAIKLESSAMRDHSCSLNFDIAACKALHSGCNGGNFLDNLTGWA
jgi:hypothetical protein